MKIAFVLAEFPTLSETFILNQITGLIDLGNEVDIFAFRKSEQKRLHSDILTYDLLSKVRYFEVIPKTRIKRLTELLKIVFRFGLSHSRELIQCLKHRVDINRYQRINNLYTISYFLDKKYEIVHCHFGDIGNNLVFMKEIFPNIKFITHFRGYDYSKVIKEKSPQFYRNLFDKSDLIISISEYIKEQLVNIGCDIEKIKVLHSGIKIEKFKYRQITYNKNNPIKILTIARLVEKKGLQYSIRAVAKLINKNFNIEYNICGDGPLKSFLEKIILEDKLNGKINLLGWKNRDEVVSLLNESHIFVLTSITAEDGDKEGQGNVLAEAQASGLPVIATNHNGFPESIVDGKSGFLVPEKDVEELEKKIEYLIKHHENWVEMGNIGRRFVEENFDITKLNKKLFEIYKNLILIKE